MGGGLLRVGTGKITVKTATAVWTSLYAFVTKKLDLITRLLKKSDYKCLSRQKLVGEILQYVMN